MGARSCIGERLSIIEMKTILINFLKKFDYDILTNPQSIKWGFKITYEPEEKVEFVIRKRQ